MLLNEFFKEHRKVGELENAMAAQQSEMAQYKSILKEQAAQIQKVSAALEAGKLASGVVAND